MFLLLMVILTALTAFGLILFTVFTINSLFDGDSEGGCVWGILSALCLAFLILFIYCAVNEAEFDKQRQVVCENLGGQIIFGECYKDAKEVDLEEGQN